LFNPFLKHFIKRINLFFLRYLQEYQPLGTAGGLYHFRDQIFTNGTKAVVVIHADIFSVLPLHEMLDLFTKKNLEKEGSHVVLGTQANKVNYVLFTRINLFSG